MTTDGVLGAAYLPTDGYIDPSQLTFALAEGARRRGAEINTNTRVTGIATERGRGDRGRDRQGRDRDGDRRQRRAACTRARSARWRGSPSRSCRWRTSTSCTKPSGLPTRHADDARPVAPRLLPPRVGRPDHGRLRARAARRGRSTASRPTSTAKLLEEDWPRFEELMENAIVRVPVARATWRSIRLINGPGGVHAGRRVHPRPDRRARLLGRRGLLRARPRRRGRHGAARRRVDRRGHAVARRLAHGLAPLRRRLPQPRVHARPHDRGLRDLLRRQVPRARAAGGAAAAGLARLRAAAASSAPSFGEKSGWERANWFEPNAAARATSRCARAAGRGSSGRPRSAPSTAACRETAALFDETSFAKIEVSGEGAAAFLEGLCANRVARDVGAVTYTQMLNPRRRDRVRLHGHAPRRGSLPHRHGHRVRPARPRLDPPARARRRLRARRRRDLGVRLLRALGAARPRHPAAAHDRGPLERGVPVHARAGARGRTACRCLALRVTYVGELGWELYCPTEFGLAPLGHALGGGPRARARRRRLQGDRLAAAREGLPRLGRRHHARGHAVRGGLGFAVKLDKGDFLGRDALVEAGPEPERRLALPDARRPALGRARLGAGARRRRPRSGA